MNIAREIENALETTLLTDVEKLQKRAAARSASKLALKGEVRATYIPTASFELAQYSTGRPFTKYTVTTQSPGLIENVLAFTGQDISEPISIQVLNSTEDGEGNKLPVPLEAFAERGYRVSQSKLAWNWGKVKHWLETAFPQAIDFGAYNHGLRAPVIPRGFFPDVTVEMADSMTVKDGQAILAGADGHGLYDPEHPEMAGVVELYGPVPLQFRAIASTGFFAKGLLKPVPGCAMGKDSPFVFDYLNVKGVHKDLFKALHGTGKRRLVDNVHIGIIKAFDKTLYMSAGFEQVENIVFDKEVYSLMEELVRERMQELFKKGWRGHVDQVCEEDEALGLVLSLVNRINELRLATHMKLGGTTATYVPLDPMSIDTIRGAVQLKLQKKLWKIAAGAGIKGRQLALIIDASLEEGTVYVKNVKPGTEYCCYRFPTITANALQTGVVTEAPEGFYTAKNTLYMNPLDALKFQGDDDGDIVGFSTDPRSVALFKKRANDTFFAIEPSGTKLDMATDSPEGWDYVSTDPRGPVGVTTMAISKLRALGEHDFANGVAVLNQEVIDVAKKQVRFTDWRAAAVPMNWKLCLDGKHHIHWARIDSGYVALDEVRDDMKVLETSDNYLGYEFPGKELAKWMAAIMRKHGVEKEQNVLGWRETKGFINYENWNTSFDNQNGYEGGNTVHASYDLARTEFKKYQLELPTESIDMREVLFEALRSTGNNIGTPNMTWTKYQTLRKSIGIDKLGKAIRDIKNGNLDDEYKAQAIDGALEVFAYSIKDLDLETFATVWWFENTECWESRETEKSPKKLGPKHLTDAHSSWKKNNPMHAWRAITSKYSPVLAALGVNKAEQCNWLEEASRVSNSTRHEYVVGAVFDKQFETPFIGLAHMVSGNRGHGRAIKDENGEAIELHQCRYCCSKLQTGVVHSVRKQKRKQDHESLNSIRETLNQALRA